MSNSTDSSRPHRKGKKQNLFDVKDISLWKRASMSGLEWEMEDLEVVVHWVRQIFAFVCGIVWGLIPLEGFTGNVLFLALNVTVLFLYYTKYLGADDEELGRWELISSGFMPSYAIFLVCWITTYSQTTPA